MNHSEFIEITFNLLKAQVKSRVQGAVGFGFASLQLENWRESNQSCNYFGQSFENFSVTSRAISKAEQRPDWKKFLSGY